MAKMVTVIFVFVIPPSQMPFVMILVSMNSNAW